MVAKIWKFFAEVKVGGETKRKCLKCGELLATPKDRSTSNMINHLKTKGHEDELKQYEADDPAAVSDIIFFIKWLKIFLDAKNHIFMDTKAARDRSTRRCWCTIGPYNGATKFIAMLFWWRGCQIKNDEGLPGSKST